MHHSSLLPGRFATLLAASVLATLPSLAGAQTVAPTSAPAMAAPVAAPAAASTPAPPVAGPAARAQVAPDYRIRVGDEVSLAVFGEVGLTPTQPMKVLPGGTIAVPLAGVVSVAGKTTRAASDAIALKLKRYLRNPQVTLSVFTIALVDALVLGNVKTPGKYTLQQPARVTDIIAAAGGLGPTDGDLPVARLINPDGSTVAIPLQKLLHDGDTELNIAVTTGSEIYVPAPTVFNIRVLGAVDKPGDVALHEGDDLAMAVARAAPSEQQNPDLNNIVVTRTGADGKTTTKKVNLYDILKKGDLSNDIVMNKGDLVYVPASPKKGPGAGDALSILRRFIFPF